MVIRLIITMAVAVYSCGIHLTSDWSQHNEHSRKDFEHSCFYYFDRNTPLGESHMKVMGMLVGNLIKPLKETNLGVAQALFDTILIYTPKRDDEHPRDFHIGVPPPPGNTLLPVFQDHHLCPLESDL